MSNSGFSLSSTVRSPAVDNYLFDLPENHRLLAEVLREIIFSHVKGVDEQLKWGCPFYSKDGLLCYINVDRQLRKVVLAFVEGFLLEDKYQAFARGTKNIRKLPIGAIDAINEKQIVYYLRQAVRINQSKNKNFLNISKKR